jgi:hypothetical protein
MKQVGNPISRLGQTEEPWLPLPRQMSNGREWSDIRRQVGVYELLPSSKKSELVECEGYRGQLDNAVWAMSQFQPNTVKPG